MARTRSLKPGFFKNEDLASHSPLCRLLFQGLWLLADREGRLEDRPARIKTDILPYDKCNVDAFLTELDAAGFVLRYEVSGRRFIQVMNFLKHQTPHVKEVASTIPAPDLPGLRLISESLVTRSSLLDPRTSLPAPHSLEERELDEMWGTESHPSGPPPAQEPDDNDREIAAIFGDVPA